MLSIQRRVDNAENEFKGIRSWDLIGINTFPIYSRYDFSFSLLLKGFDVRLNYKLLNSHLIAAKPSPILEVNLLSQTG
jgi:hypothetical protein